MEHVIIGEFPQKGRSLFLGGAVAVMLVWVRTEEPDRRANKIATVHRQYTSCATVSRQWQCDGMEREWTSEK